MSITKINVKGLLLTIMVRTMNVNGMVEKYLGFIMFKWFF